jgi:hypothetical protein
VRGGPSCAFVALLTPRTGAVTGVVGLPDEQADTPDHDHPTAPERVSGTIDQLDHPDEER